MMAVPVSMKTMWIFAAGVIVGAAAALALARKEGACSGKLCAPGTALPVSKSSDEWDTTIAFDKPGASIDMKCKCKNV